ncbi:MAG: MraY family glycosyltransferase [Candidatus Gastranaerophilales bacterium]|nr:MraY family glycosyltransferase [Candidatus Gastranaerophilales bacterium]
MTILQLSEAQIIGAIISFILGVFIVPVVIYISEKKGLVDQPNARKIHSIPIPRLGGVAIWLSTMFTFLFLIVLSYYPYGSLLSGILLGSSLMFLLGLIDDIYMLDAKFKLFIQISIATIVFCLGIRIETIYNPFGASIVLNPIVSYILTLGWIVGISNAINFIDGVDGLAGSVITISSVTLGLLAAAMVPSNTVTALIAFILAGSMLAFLSYNFHPAKIFMGDSGALFGGFLLATLSITGITKTASPAMYMPLIVLSVPIIDITFSSLRRIAKGTSPFVADAEHIHHKLLKAGFSQNKTVLILATFALFSGALATMIVSTSLVKYFLYAVGISFVMLLLNFLAKK